MKNFTRLIALTLLTLTAVATTSPAADAIDRRPCVSQAEYRSAPGAYLHSLGIITPGEALNRRALERVWEVRGLGRPDPKLTDAKSTFWVYPACGYSLEEAQVWVVTDHRNGAADVMERWVAPGATLHGHK